jgi:5-hydroxyisourate hydrolase
MAGYLTTHVLDVAQGKPAAGVEIELWRLDAGGEGRQFLARTRTNTEGRTDTPLIPEGRLETGTYELVFAVGAYFAGQPVARAEPQFLDDVPVRFAVADAAAHYHVPLLVTPWAYSTYRGS